jgi:aspartate kinase
MKIYKFGGASVKNADAIKNLKNIVSAYSGQIVVVISAMDKITNVLEQIHQHYIQKDTLSLATGFEALNKFHLDICKNLFNGNYIPKQTLIHFQHLQEKLFSTPSMNHDYEYDQIVCYGELLSTSIIADYLNKNGYPNQYLDIRTILRTNTIYREAEIDWHTSEKLLTNYFGNNTLPVITQGFIASTPERISTTLGREGSDFSAAALGYMLNAEDVTIWKDVPGIMNADPTWCDFAEKIDTLSYQEAIELSFYGAKVIHPKTIKPLQNKSIPLNVKSFLHPDEKGTIIKKIDYKLQLIPVYIIKENQTLLSISPRDFSFIVEENISRIFAIFAQHRIKVNIIQNSAISLSASIDYTKNLETLITKLNKDYQVKYNSGLTLITIRHYTESAIEKMTINKKILMEQRSRLTLRMVTEKNQ